MSEPAAAEMELLPAALRRLGLDSVDGAFAYEGGLELSKPGLSRRRRTRLEVADEAGRRHVLYLKRYGPEPISTALRRWWTHRRRRSAARLEFESIAAARAAGIPTMRGVLCGEDPCPIGARRSYLIVTAVPGEALERSMEGYLRRHCGDGAAAELARRLAELVRSLHDSGHAHRDLYSSHVFLEDSPDGPRLHLIDLARMFAPRLRRYRWYVKDMAQLKYSLPPAWVAEHWQVLLDEYLPGVGAGAIRRFDAAVDAKVASIRHRADALG